MHLYNLVNIQIGIIFGTVSRLHKNEVKDLVILSTMTRTKSCSFYVLGRPTTKSILILSHYHVGLSIYWVRHPVLRCSVLIFWQLGNSSTNIEISRSIPSNQKFSILWYILVKIWWMEWLEPWACSINFRSQIINIGHTQSTLFLRTPPVYAERIIKLTQHLVSQFMQNYVEMLLIFNNYNIGGFKTWIS